MSAVLDITSEGRGTRTGITGQTRIYMEQHKECLEEKGPESLSQRVWRSSNEPHMNENCGTAPSSAHGGGGVDTVKSAFSLELLRSLDFVVFLVTVAAFSLLSFEVLSQKFGNNEIRDRWFYLSILVIAEFSYWCSRIVAWAARGSRSSGGSTLFVRSGAATWFFYVMPAAVGGVVFLLAAPNLNLSALVGIVALLGYQFARDRLRALRWLEVFEVPLSVFVVYQGMLWMALRASKEPHHWSFYLGPAQSVFQGGHLLWDVPSQYGFLSVWTIATLAKLVGTDPITSMGIVVEGLQLLAVIIAVCVFKFRLGFSTFVSTVLAVSVLLCLPGFEWYHGPVHSPSISAIRFLPSLVALLSVDHAVRYPSRGWSIVAAVAVAVACLWSAESLLYTVAPLGGFISLSFVRSPSRSFFKSPIFVILPLALVLGGGFLGAYALSTPHGIDLQSFYEYAQAYAEHKGVLPIESSAWAWTWLFIFVVSSAFFVARLGFAGGGLWSSQGALFFMFIMCTGTYFIARSSYRNVQNLIPWFLIASAAMVVGANSSGRKAQRSLVFVVASLALVSFASFYGPDNRSTIAQREALGKIYAAPSYQSIPSDVATAARTVANSSLFTFIHFDSMYGYSPEIDSLGNALPISPLSHFATPHDLRIRVYTQRMLERVPESYVLCEARVCPGVPYIFREMGKIIEVKEVPYEFSREWPMYRLRRIQ